MTASVPLTFFGVLALLLGEAYVERRSTAGGPDAGADARVGAGADASDHAGAVSARQKALG